MKLTTDAMELVSFVVLKDRAEALASFLAHSGSFHPVDIREVEPGIGPLKAEESGQDLERFERLQSKAVSLASQLAVSLEPRRDLAGIEPASAEALLAKIEEEARHQLAERDGLREKVKADETLLAQVREGPPLLMPREDAYSQLFVCRGSIEEKSLELLRKSLAETVHVLYPYGKEGNRVRLVLLGLRRDRELLNEAAQDAGWQEEPGRPSLSPAEQELVRGRIADAKRRIEETEKAIEAARPAAALELSRINSYCALTRSLAESRRRASATERTTVFSGWVPSGERQKVVGGVEAVAGASYAEAKRAEDSGVAKEDIPVRFGDRPFLGGFSLLVESYGLPRYGSIDPTVFVAISFVFMFGLMFGDLGQGLVFALIGALLLRHKSQVMRRFAALALYCGLSAAVFGFLEGSAFGFEFPSLWEKPMEDVMGILRFSLYGGITLLSAGIVINIVNAFRERDFVKAVFDRAGLVGGVVYWCLIAVISRQMFEHKVVPSALYMVIAAGLGLLFVFPLAEFFLHRHKGATFIESAVESVLGLLEFGMNYLANTVSFVRMGAFGLAHAALFLAVFQIGKMFPGAGNALVIVGGNIAIMVLEGVVVGIQALRLNYYEFFSKFFVSGKTAFKPLEVRYN